MDTIYYHGSTTLHNFNVNGYRTYFTDSIDYALNYGTYITAVRLIVHNPLYVYFDGDIVDECATEETGKIVYDENFIDTLNKIHVKPDEIVDDSMLKRNAVWEVYNDAYFFDKVKENGYDAIIGNENGTNVIAVLSNKQIKILWQKNIQNNMGIQKYSYTNILNELIDKAKKNNGHCCTMEYRGINVIMYSESQHGVRYLFFIGNNCIKIRDWKYYNPISLYAKRYIDDEILKQKGNTFKPDKDSPLFNNWNNIKQNLTESKIAELVTEEIKKSDVVDLIKKDKDFEKRVKEITKDVITDLFRALWQHNSILQSLVK